MVNKLHRETGNTHMVSTFHMTLEPGDIIATGTPLGVGFKRKPPLNPPWGGHSFNTGIGDAVNIGWKLAAVLNGWGGASLLASYEAERRAIAEQTIQTWPGAVHLWIEQLPEPLSIRFVGLKPKSVPYEASYRCRH